MIACAAPATGKPVLRKRWEKDAVHLGEVGLGSNPARDKSMDRGGRQNALPASHKADQTAEEDAVCRSTDDDTLLSCRHPDAPLTACTQKACGVLTSPATRAEADKVISGSSLDLRFWPIAGQRVDGAQIGPGRPSTSPSTQSART